MSITAQQLLQILPNAGAKAGVFAPVLNTAMQRYQIVGARAYGLADADRLVARVVGTLTGWREVT